MELDYEHLNKRGDCRHYTGYVVYKGVGCLCLRLADDVAFGIVLFI